MSALQQDRRPTAAAAAAAAASSPSTSNGGTHGPSHANTDSRGAGRSVSISIPPAIPRPPKPHPSDSSSSGNASLPSSVANLANTIIGTGMVALPGAFVYTGWLLGSLLIVFCGFTGASGLYLLTRCANKLGGRRQSFFTVALKTIPKGARWFDLAIALKCYGVSISYLIISGQLMPQVVLSMLKAAGHEHGAIPAWLLDRDFWITFLVVLLLPLCFLRKLDSLRHTSYLSLMAVVYLVVIVIVFFLDQSSLPPRGEVHAVVLSPHILAIFPVFVFAFTCAQNMLPVYNELSASDPLMHMDRAKWAIGSSIGGAGAVYTMVSLLGYAEFGANLGDNIIAMYPSSSIFVSFGRLSIVLLTIFSYPLQIHPCRAAVDKVISPPQLHPGVVLPNDFEDDDEEEESNGGDDHNGNDGYQSLLASQASLSPRPDEMPLLRWVTITFFLLVTTFTVSLLVDDLSIVLGFVGSLGSTTISFILPGILYASLHPDQYEELSTNPDEGQPESPSQTPGRRLLRRDPLRRPALALACWGVLVGTVALASNIAKLVHAGVAVGGEAKADRLATLVGRWDVMNGVQAG